MARSFNGANPDSIAIASAIASSYPFSASIWFNPNTTASEMSTFCISGAQSGFAYRSLVYRGDSGGSGSTKSIQVITNDQAGGGGNFTNLDTATNLSTNTWHNGVCVFNSTTTDLYLDNTHFSTSFAAHTFSSQASSLISGFYNGSASVSLGFSGLLADFAVWSVALTATEASALNNGARPFAIRPASLIGYWPVDGLQSPEPDLSGQKNNGTLTGSTKASGPPFMLFTPRWPMVTPVTLPPPPPPSPIGFTHVEW